MAPDLTPVARLLHHAAWMFYVQSTTAAHRDAINAHAYAPGADVPVNSAFLSGDHEEFEEVTATLNALGWMESRAYGSDMLEHRFLGEGATLLQAIGAPDAPDVDAGTAFQLMLGLAADFHLSFESMKDGRFALPEIPIGQGAFDMPQMHEAVVPALMALGFLARQGSAWSWTPDARPHFEALGLWIGPETRDTLYRDRLRQIWQAMPEGLKAASVTLGGEISVLNLATVLAQFLQDDQWAASPHSGDLALRGGTIVMAKDMWRLQDRGELT